MSRISVFQGCGVVRFYNHTHSCYISAESSFVGKLCEFPDADQQNDLGSSDEVIQKDGMSCSFINQCQSTSAINLLFLKSITEKKAL